MSIKDELDAIKRASKNKSESPASSPRSSPASVKKPEAKTLAYYDISRQSFLIQSREGSWIPFTEASVKRLLKHRVFHEIDNKEQQTWRADKEILRMQTEDNVAYAGAIAGYTSGIREICGQRILITNGPKLIEPKEGNWPTLRPFLETLLGDQLKYFYGWVKCACRTLYAGPPFRPGQLLALAGPAGCGKSLLQNLITEILGGRAAKPYRYMTGETAFNSDLLQAEHLMIEDEFASSDLRVRRQFGSSLKAMIVNESQSLHRKGRDALTVTPFTRITITLNDEAENLMVLPPMDDSLRDKIILLQAYRAKFPYADDNLVERNQWRAKLSAELPAFLHFLRSWRLPANMSNQRYGVTAYQSPQLLGELDDMSPEVKLLNLIDTLRPWGIDNQPFVGTSSQLEEILQEKDKLGRVVRLLSYNTACGVYLSRLESRFGERVSSKPGEGRRKIWTIKPIKPKQS